MTARIEQIAAASEQIAASAQSMQDSIGEVAAVAEESSAVDRGGLGLDRGDLRLGRADRSLRAGALRQRRDAQPARRHSSRSRTEHHATRSRGLRASLATRSAASGAPEPGQPRTGRPSCQTRTEPRQLVVFTLGAEQYALPIKQVKEIIRYTQPRSVASNDYSVQGVISLRGQIVPVYDLASRLGASSELGEHSKIVIVETAEQTVGVIVDAVDEVLTVEDDQLEASPAPTQR